MKLRSGHLVVLGRVLALALGFASAEPEGSCDPNPLPDCDSPRQPMIFIPGTSGLDGPSRVAALCVAADQPLDCLVQVICGPLVDDDLLNVTVTALSLEPIDHSVGIDCSVGGFV